MNLKFIVCLILLLSSCSKTPLHVKAAHQFMYTFDKRICKQEQIMIFGSGGAMVGSIKEIFRSYHSKDRLTIDEARIKLVRITEDLLSQINADIKIRPFLNTYPFTEKNLTIQLGFENEQGGFVEPPFIALVTSKNGMISYSIEVGKKYTLDDTYNESYEDALRIYHEQLGLQIE